MSEKREKPIYMTKMAAPSSGASASARRKADAEARNKAEQATIEEARAEYDKSIKK